MNDFKRLRTVELHTLWKQGLVGQEDAQRRCEILDEEWDQRITQGTLTVGQLIEEWERANASPTE
jgi:hypothetical protein